MLLTMYLGLLVTGVSFWVAVMCIAWLTSLKVVTAFVIMVGAILRGIITFIGWQEYYPPSPSGDIKFVGGE